MLADEIKNNLHVKKAEIVSLNSEHQNEIHILDQRYVKSLLEAIAMNLCKSMATLGSKGQESSRNVAELTEQLDPQEYREFRSGSGICQYMTEQRCDIAFSTKEILRYAAGPLTASQTKLKRIARYLKGRQRCGLNFPLGVKAGRRHPCDCGCRLVWRPKDKVLHVWWSVGNRSVLDSSTLACDTGNSIAVLSRVRGQGDHDGLH